MQRIGLIGGMSWQSSALYYQLINQGVAQRLGGLHSADLVLRSVDFTQIEVLQARGQWPEAGQILAQVAQDCVNAGADLVLICTNTMHKVFHQVQAQLAVPLLHIADCVASAAQQKSQQILGLLGTAFTMEQDFYTQRLQDKHGMQVIVPEAEERKIVHSIIYDELCQGQIRAESKQAYLRIIENLQQQGCQAVILGCTEIGLLVQQSDCTIPLIDSTVVHAEQAVDCALSKVLA